MRDKLVPISMGNDHVHSLLQTEGQVESATDNLIYLYDFVSDRKPRILCVLFIVTNESCNTNP